MRRVSDLSSGRQLKILSGNANPKLAWEVAQHLGQDLVRAEVGRFVDGEVSVVINESIRGSDLFIIQPTSPPVNDNLIELLIMIDAARRASAARVNIIIPYFGYARQDRKTRPREPITAKLCANMLTAAGAHRVISLDLHSPAIQGFFDIPVDHLQGGVLLADYFLSLGIKDPVVVSPDRGGVPRCRDLGDRLGDVPIAIIDKVRIPGQPSYIKKMDSLVGDVCGKTAIILDDIIDSAGTIVKAAKLLQENGARDIYAAASHALFSGNAVQYLEYSPIQEVVVLDTISIDGSGRNSPKLRVISVAPLLAEVIKMVNQELSVSSLFRAM